MHWLERRRVWLIAPLAFAGLVAVSSRRGKTEEDSGPVDIREFDPAGNPLSLRRLPPVVKSDAEWKAQLSNQQFYVTRKGSTDTPYTGTYYHQKAKGIYACIGCGTVVFRSQEKFDSGTGWPSFWNPADPHNIRTRQDVSMFLERTEVACARCGAHLGHVFPDGPPPTNLRYCINESSLHFVQSW